MKVTKLLLAALAIISTGALVTLISFTPAEAETSTTALADTFYEDELYTSFEYYSLTDVNTIYEDVLETETDVIDETDGNDTVTDDEFHMYYDRGIDSLEVLITEGIPYPCDDFLATLTEEQAASIIGLIDSFNAQDLAVLTTEELLAALSAFQEDLLALYDELGIEVPQFDQHVRDDRFIDALKEVGFPVPTAERFPNLTEEQLALLVDKVSDINATYDFTVMTDDELRLALDTIKDELTVFAVENGFEILGPRSYHDVAVDRVEGFMGSRLDLIRENGFVLPTEGRIVELLTEEQVVALQALVDDFNNTTDFTVMSDDEIKTVLDEFKTVVDAYLTEQGVELPIMERPFVDPHHDDESDRPFDDRRPFDRDRR